MGDIPSAIWMPGDNQAQLPCCYQGSPLEMVQDMADEMNPKLGVDDTIDTVLKMLHETGLPITGVPTQAHEEIRATMFVTALLLWGVAEPMAQA